MTEKGKDNLKKVSIIMPCYNDGAFIEEAIASVKAQTYKDIEIVIIDDGSDDQNTINILHKIKNDNNLTIFYTDHIGPASARNYGIYNCNGEYILPVDSDDKIDPTYIEKAVKILNSDTSVGVVYCKADFFGLKTGMWDLPEYSFDKMLTDNIVFVTSMFRKYDWQRVGGYCTEFHDGMEDYDFWLSILELDRKIIQIPEVLFHYRIKSVSRTTRFMKDINVVKNTYALLHSRHLDFYNKHGEKLQILLRNELINKIFIIRQLQESIGIIEKIKKFSLLKKIIKKIIIKN